MDKYQSLIFIRVEKPHTPAIMVTTWLVYNQDLVNLVEHGVDQNHIVEVKIVVSACSCAISLVHAY